MINRRRTACREIPLESSTRVVQVVDRSTGGNERMTDTEWEIHIKAISNEPCLHLQSGLLSRSLPREKTLCKRALRIRHESSRFRRSPLEILQWTIGWRMWISCECHRGGPRHLEYKTHLERVVQESGWPVTDLQRPLLKWMQIIIFSHSVPLQSSCDLVCSVNTVRATLNFLCLFSIWLSAHAERVRSAHCWQCWWFH